MVAALAGQGSGSRWGPKSLLTERRHCPVTCMSVQPWRNAARADIFLSIHHDSDQQRGAEGVAAYYFCRQGYFSEAGSLLAQHIVDRVAAELEVPALPALGRNYAVLRETVMTAVMIEPLLRVDLLAEKGDIDDLAAA